MAASQRTIDPKASNPSTKDFLVQKIFNDLGGPDRKENTKSELFLKSIQEFENRYKGKSWLKPSELAELGRAIAKLEKAKKPSDNEAIKQKLQELKQEFVNLVKLNDHVIQHGPFFKKGPSGVVESQTPHLDENVILFSETVTKQIKLKLEELVIKIQNLNAENIFENADEIFKSLFMNLNVLLTSSERNQFLITFEYQKKDNNKRYLFDRSHQIQKELKNESWFSESIIEDIVKAIGVIENKILNKLKPEAYRPYICTLEECLADFLMDNEILMREGFFVAEPATPTKKEVRKHHPDMDDKLTALLDIACITNRVNNFITTFNLVQKAIKPYKKDTIIFQDSIIINIKKIMNNIVQRIGLEKQNQSNKVSAKYKDLILAHQQLTLQLQAQTKELEELKNAMAESARGISPNSVASLDSVSESKTSERSPTISPSRSESQTPTGSEEEAQLIQALATADTVTFVQDNRESKWPTAVVAETKERTRDEIAHLTAVIEEYKLREEHLAIELKGTIETYNKRIKDLDAEAIRRSKPKDHFDYFKKEEEAKQLLNKNMELETQNAELTKQLTVASGSSLIQLLKELKDEKAHHLALQRELDQAKHEKLLMEQSKTAALNEVVPLRQKEVRLNEMEEKFQALQQLQAQRERLIQELEKKEKTLEEENVKLTDELQSMKEQFEIVTTDQVGLIDEARVEIRTALEIEMKNELEQARQVEQRIKDIEEEAIFRIQQAEEKAKAAIKEADRLNELRIKAELEKRDIETKLTQIRNENATTDKLALAKAKADSELKEQLENVRKDRDHWKCEFETLQSAIKDIGPEIKEEEPTAEDRAVLKDMILEQIEEEIIPLQYQLVEATLDSMVQQVVHQAEIDELKTQRQPRAIIDLDFLGLRPTRTKDAAVQTEGSQQIDLESKSAILEHKAVIVEEVKAKASLEVKKEESLDAQYQQLSNTLRTLKSNSSIVDLKSWLTDYLTRIPNVIIRLEKQPVRTFSIRSEMRANGDDAKEAKKTLNKYSLIIAELLLKKPAPSFDQQVQFLEEQYLFKLKQLKTTTSPYFQILEYFLTTLYSHPNFILEHREEDKLFADQNIPIRRFKIVGALKELAKNKTTSAGLSFEKLEYELKKSDPLTLPEMEKTLADSKKIKNIAVVVHDREPTPLPKPLERGLPNHSFFLHASEAKFLADEKKAQEIAEKILPIYNCLKKTTEDDKTIANIANLFNIRVLQQERKKDKPQGPVNYSTAVQGLAEILVTRLNIDLNDINPFAKFKQKKENDLTYLLIKMLSDIYKLDSFNPNYNRRLYKFVALSTFINSDAMNHKLSEFIKKHDKLFNSKEKSVFIQFA